MNFLSTPVKVETSTIQSKTLTTTQNSFTESSYTFSQCLFYQCDGGSNLAGAISVDTSSTGSSFTIEIIGCTFFCCRSQGAGAVSVGHNTGWTSINFTIHNNDFRGCYTQSTLLSLREVLQTGSVYDFFDKSSAQNLLLKTSGVISMDYNTFEKPGVNNGVLSSPSVNIFTNLPDFSNLNFSKQGVNDISEALRVNYASKNFAFNYFNFYDQKGRYLMNLIYEQSEICKMNIQNINIINCELVDGGDMLWEYTQDSPSYILLFDNKLEITEELSLSDISIINPIFATSKAYFYFCLEISTLFREAESFPSLTVQNLYCNSNSVFERISREDKNNHITTISTYIPTVSFSKPIVVPTDVISDPEVDLIVPDQNEPDDNNDNTTIIIIVVVVVVVVVIVVVVLVLVLVVFKDKSKKPKKNKNKKRESSSSDKGVIDSMTVETKIQTDVNPLTTFTTDNPFATQSSMLPTNDHGFSSDPFRHNEDDGDDDPDDNVF
ncbi:uncharacterized protein GO595_000823 [Histomonas meleagridis]|uniref:uncharacterized protein n=1 Tax=Histomonas meleagridis TaxID=135588 RepID=UPI0035599726|nr:hypothetical protein GO595_000823 [Histomonas meleagridis]